MWGVGGGLPSRASYVHESEKLDNGVGPGFVHRLFVSITSLYHIISGNNMLGSMSGDAHSSCPNINLRIRRSGRDSVSSKDVLHRRVSSFLPLSSEQLS